MRSNQRISLKRMIILMLSIVLLLSPVSTVYGADDAYDRMKYSDFTYNDGLGASDTDDALRISWREGPTLRAYAAAYESYKDTFWLDKSVDHIDSVLSNALDLDGDGYKGWYSSYESLQYLWNYGFEEDGADANAAEVLKNTGFESALIGDQLTPENWERASGDSMSVYRTTTTGEYYSGNAGVAVKFDGTTPASLKQSFKYETGTRYVVSFMVKTNDRKTAGKVQIFNDATNRPITGSDTFGYESIFVDGWMQGSFTFSAPHSERDGISIRISLLPGYEHTDWVVYFDDISIKPAETYANKLQNGDFEILNSTDVTMADKWERVGPTTSSNAYVSNVSGEVFGGDQGFVINSNASWQSIRQAFSYKPGASYTVSFRGKTNSTANSGRVSVHNLTTNTYTHYNFSNTEWKDHSFSFTAPSASGQTLVIRLWHASNTAGATIHYDDVDVRSAESTLPQKLVNSSMEMPDSADATLPDGWERDGLAANFYRSDAPGEFYNGSWGLVTQFEYTKKVQQAINYAPDTRYLLTGFAKTSGSDINGKIVVYDATIDDVIGWSPVYGQTDWTRQKIVFTAPEEAGHDLYIQLFSPTTTGGNVYYDDIGVTPYDSNQLKNNSGFENSYTSDSTMPVGWERSPATTSTAFLTSTMNEYWNKNANAAQVNAMVVKSDSNQIQSVRHLLDLTPGADYTVKFDGRNNVSGSQGQVDVYNATTNQVLGYLTFSNTSWDTHTFRFIAPSASSDVVYMRIRHAATTAEDHIAYVDNVNVFPNARAGFRSWNRVNLDREYAYATGNTEEVYTGSNSLVIHGTGQGHVEQEIMTYEPGAPYEVYFNGKVNSSSSVGKVEVFDETANAALASMTFNNTSWTSYTRLQFTAPAAGHVIKIRLSQTSTNASDTAYFDSVAVSARTENFVNNYFIAKPILNFVRIIQEDPTLHSAYLSKAQEYLSFIERDIFPKFESNYTSLPNDRGIYTHANNYASRWFAGRSAPHNQYLTAAECAMLLWDITGNSNYWTRAYELLNTFKDYIVPNTYDAAASQWNYWDPITSNDDNFWYTQVVEDRSHGTLDISAVLTAYEYGFPTFSVTDLQKIVAQFKDVMWNQSYTQPIFGYRINMRGSTTYDYLRYPQAFDDWVRYARVEPELLNIIEAGMYKDRSRILPAAQMAQYNPERIINGDMELPDLTDNTLPAFWNRALGSSITAYIDSSAPYKGDSSLTLKTDGSTSTILEQQMKNYKPNSDYTLSFTGKASNPAEVKGLVEIYNYTTSTTLASVMVDTTCWDSYSIPWTTPSSATNDIRVRITYDNAVSAHHYVYIDELRMYASLWNSFTLNSGFEQPAVNDATLPMYWKRADGTGATNAAITTSDQYKGTSSVQLTTNPSAGLQQLYFELKGIKPGETYNLTLNGKTNGSAAEGKVYIYNETTSTVLASITMDQSSWTAYQASFTAPNSSDVVKVFVGHQDPNVSGGVVLVDELGVVLQ